MKFRIIALVILLAAWLTPVYAGPIAPVVDKVATGEKVVALTFEGIGTAAELEDILRLCREHGIKGTFFISGRLLAGLPLKEAVKEGHEIGNYGMDREYWAEWSDEAIASNLQDSARAVQAAAGVAPRVARPPYSYYGDNLRQAAARLIPAPTVVRGLDTGDWLLDSPEAVLEMVGRVADRGDIINFHSKAKNAMAALPGVITYLKGQGYAFVTVSQLQAKVQTVKPQPPSSAGEMAVIKTVSTAKPYIALTFDDGGPAWQVAEMLDILKEFEVKSTFFLVGNWVRANPGLVRRMAAEGHEIANHSFTHPRFNLLSAVEMREEILATQAAIQEAAGQPPAAFFRPPYGIYNGTLTAVLKDMGYKALVLWDVDPRDWNGSGPEVIASRAYDAAGPGSVVLFHLHGASTPEALRRLIPLLQNRGYVLTTLGRMTDEAG